MAAFSQLRAANTLEEQRADTIGKNSEVFAVMDPVSVDANGFLIVATAGVKVLGYCNKAVTMASDNQTVAKVKPPYLPAEGRVMLGESDQAWTQTDVGAYADLTGTTGSMQLNFLAGSTGQFYVMEGDPLGTGSTTQVAFTVAEPQTSASAQS